ncbi:MAG: ferrochelatase [Pseudomonadales bacterium]|nr:ferrochelatase [Pseudomonadales bacterium]MBO6597433.1 ferrochelatase [Pseudomonadales bacterium]
MTETRTAVMLINLGTPDRPDEESIRRYLKQFLSDPRVVDFPRWLWLPILNGIILRTRPPKLVHNYELIWGTHDGPIRTVTSALERRIQTRMPNVTVVSAMTYGSPSIASVLETIRDVDHVVVLPLFPQYAGATTGAVADELERAIAETNSTQTFELIEHYFDDPQYIDALAASIKSHHAYRTGAPKVVFSFHGIPQSQSNRGDPYAAQCAKTAALVAEKLGLPKDRWIQTYQSRFGPLPWLKPYTDITMEALPSDGVDDVLVVCPGFSVDCLETVEEIRIQNRDIFLEAGGKRFNYVKALNASHRHADCLADILGNKLP